MRDLTSKVDRYRKEAVKCHERAKIASPAFLSDFYRNIAVRYLFMAEDASRRAEEEGRTWNGPRCTILSAEVNAKDGSPRISNCSPYWPETHALGGMKIRDSWNRHTVPEIAGDLGACMSGRLRILVVEDDFILSIMMQDALSNAGFDVVGIARMRSRQMYWHLSNFPISP